MRLTLRAFAKEGAKVSRARAQLDLDVVGRGERAHYPSYCQAQTRTHACQCNGQARVGMQCACIKRSEAYRHALQKTNVESEFRRKR